MKNITQLTKNVVKILDTKKADAVVAIDLSGRANRLTDVCVIASGTSARHVQAVADYIYRYFKDEKLYPKIEGTAQSGWVMIEASGIEVHLFKPELREYYDIETLLAEQASPSQLLQDVTNLSEVDSL